MHAANPRDRSFWWLGPRRSPRRTAGGRGGCLRQPL